MSAAAFLGIAALVYSNGFDGLIYSIGFLVGWPIVLFLIAERLRNLGRYTFADVASFRLDQTPVRIFAAVGSLVGRRVLPDRADGGRGQADPAAVRPRLSLCAVIIVGVLMMIYVTVGGMQATTWVQIIKAVLLLIGAHAASALLVLLAISASDLERCSPRRSSVHPEGRRRS